MSPSIDCVVVGYNDTPFEELLERNAPFQDLSGGYRHLLVNSAVFRGRRFAYCDLLNLARGATGATDALHVAKMPNLAVCYLVSFLRRRGLAIEYVNFFNEERDHFRDLLNESPRVVAITTTFYFEPEPIRQIVDMVRQYCPESKVVVGGPYVFNVCSDLPANLQDTSFRRTGADIFVFDSQGEDTLSRICFELRQDTSNLARVPNLVFKDGDNFHRTPRIAERNDINADAVDWTLFPSEFLTPTVQTRTARSCAYKCAFCRYPVMAGALEVMSLPTIERDLDYLDRIGTKYVLFIDDTFNVPVVRFKDICRLMIRKRYGFKWFSYFRCANADSECFDLMAEAGCAGVFLGIESGDDRVLKHMNKVASVAKYDHGIRELNARGVITYASFIVGYPSETEQSARNTIAFIEATRPMFYCLETFFYDPKTPIGSRAKEYGLTGTGYAWRHDTMDWRRATEIVEQAYRTIDSSVICPLYGFDLWSVAYLLGKGMTLQQITGFLSVASRLTVRGLEPSRGRAQDEEQLIGLFTASQDFEGRADQMPGSAAGVANT